MLKIPQNSKLYSKITLKLYAFMYSYAFVLPANRTKPKAHISVAKFILPHLDLNYKANIYNITTKNKNVFRSLLFLFSSWFIMQRRLYWYDKCRQCSLRDSETCRKETASVLVQCSPTKPCKALISQCVSQTLQQFMRPTGLFMLILSPVSLIVYFEEKLCPKLESLMFTHSLLSCLDRIHCTIYFLDLDRSIYLFF